MPFIHIESLRYPLTAEQVYLENRREITIPTESNMPEGYAWVHEFPPPDYDSDTQELIELDPDQDEEGKYHQVWAVEALSAEAITERLRSAKAQKLQELEHRRKAVEEGGIELPGGIRVETGKDDQNRITSVIANAHLAGVTEVDFKSASGWVKLTIEQIQQIAAAIALHVQACFTAERQHSEAIEALGTAKAVRDYDISADWPGSASPEESTEP